MGYLVRPECPKCGDNADVDEIVIGSAKKTIGGAATGAAIGSVVPGLGYRWCCWAYRWNSIWFKACRYR